MSHGSTEHNLEEAHHAEHASHDNFTRNVAMTMAIIVAGLAFVTLISHRQHNSTLELHILSNDKLTEASDKWAYYQAKKNRQYMHQDFADVLEVTAPAQGKEGKAAEVIDKWRSKTKEYEAESKTIQDEALALTAKSGEYAHEAHLSHFTTDFFDVGHLGIEIALVVCSLAVLTRKSLFWFAGVGIGILGMAVALSGFVLPPLLFQSTEAGHPGSESGRPEHQAPEKHSRLAPPAGSSWELPACT
jgi:Domain of unknown function (DUF4337)